MATYSFDNIFFYTYDGQLDDYLFGSGNTIDSTSFGNHDGTLSPNESYTVYAGPYPAGSITYLGETADGGIIVNSTVNNGYLYYTNSTTMPDTLPSYTAQDYAAPPCFCPGTQIATPTGSVAVETLKIGDEIVSAQGEVVSVKWIGRRSIHPVFALMNDALPIKIGAGALGDGLPKRDLYVSPEHAMLVDGCLVEARALVNGRTIVAVSQWDDKVEYYHIETARHDLILAEGSVTETYANTDNRKGFDNHAEYAALYPDETACVEPMALPRVCYRRQLAQRLVKRLNAIADALTPAAVAA